MSGTGRTEYVNRMNVQFGPLEVIDERRIADSCRHPWFNQTLCEVNDTWMRLGVCQGEYHWHQHEDTDEFFYVIEGRWLIDLEGRSVELHPRQGFVVPKGVRHRPREAVELRYDQRVASAQRGRRLGEPRTRSVTAGQPAIEIHAIIANAELAQNPPLRAEVLPLGRTTRVSDQDPSLERRTDASAIAPPAVQLDDVANFDQ